MTDGRTTRDDSQTPAASRTPTPIDNCGTDKLV